MGQSASLYRIDKSDFSKIVDNPNDFELFRITKGYEIFDKSFDGLQFVLAKGLDSESKNLIELIFSPTTFIGEEIDFDNLPDDIDLEKQPIYYNDPTKVSEICNLLDTISLEKFQNDFDHNELNRQGIYPSDIWNEETADNIAFNVRHMTIEFQNLKLIFKIAKENGEYLLSYVG